MTFECIDPIACDCHSHISWETHIAVCPACQAIPLRDGADKVLGPGDEQGHCRLCRRNAVFPRRHSASALPFWDWRSRDLFDHTELLPVGERAEMAANAEPGDQAPMEDDRG